MGRGQFMWAALGCVLACNPIVDLGNTVNTSTQENPSSEPVAQPDAALTNPVEGDAATINTDYDATDGLACAGLLCEGFEQGLPAGVRVDDERAATFDLVSSPVFSGTTAARFTTHADLSWSAIVLAVPAVTSGQLHVRLHALLPERSVTGRMNVITLENDDAFNVDVNFIASETQPVVESYFHTSESRWVSETDTLPVDEWFCLSVGLDIDDAAGGVDVDIDARQVLSTPRNQDTLPTGGLTRVGLGIMWTEDGQTDGELYLDDIAIDTEPLACP